MATCCTRYSVIDWPVARIVLCNGHMLHKVLYHGLNNDQDHTMIWLPAAQGYLSQTDQWPGSYSVMATCCTRYSLTDWIMARVILSYGHMLYKVLSGRLTSGQDHTMSWPPAAYGTLSQTEYWPRIILWYGNMLHKVLSRRLTSGQDHTLSWQPAAQGTLSQTE